MAKVVVKILQGSAVTQTMLAGQFLLHIFMVYICQKLWKLWQLHMIQTSTFWLMDGWAIKY